MSIPSPERTPASSAFSLLDTGSSSDSVSQHMNIVVNTSSGWRVIVLMEEQVRDHRKPKSSSAPQNARPPRAEVVPTGVAGTLVGNLADPLPLRSLRRLRLDSCFTGSPQGACPLEPSCFSQCWAWGQRLHLPHPLPSAPPPSLNPIIRGAPHLANPSSLWPALGATAH